MHCMSTLTQFSEQIAYLKPFVQIGHLLGVLSLSNLDTLLHLLSFGLNILSDSYQPIYSRFKRPDERLRIKRCQYSNKMYNSEYIVA